MNLSYLKRGTDAMKELENPVMSGGSSGKILRFYLKKDQSALLTFLDGSLLPMSETNGELVFDVPGTYEHSFMHEGVVADFICTLESEGRCPLCDERKYRFYNLFFTAIDHRKNVSKQGKVFEYNKRIVAVNRDAYKMLLKFLDERIDPQLGFVGLQMQAEKVKAKSSMIGDFFKFRGYVDLDQLKAQGMDVEPLDFSKVLVYRNCETLEKMGFGKVQAGTFQNTPYENVDDSSELMPLDDDTIPF